MHYSIFITLTDKENDRLMLGLEESKRNQKDSEHAIINFDYSFLSGKELNQDNIALFMNPVSLICDKASLFYIIILTDDIHQEPLSTALKQASFYKDKVTIISKLMSQHI